MVVGKDGEYGSVVPFSVILGTNSQKSNVTLIPKWKSLCRTALSSCCLTASGAKTSLLVFSFQLFQMAGFSLDIPLHLPLLPTPLLY